MIETISQYRMVYCIECDNPDIAINAVKNSDVEEFGQQWLGEVIMTTREVDNQEALKVHDELNDYLVNWTDEQKLNRIAMVV
jgi:hypothetical protein